MYSYPIFYKVSLKLPAFNVLCEPPSMRYNLHQVLPYQTVSSQNFFLAGAALGITGKYFNRKYFKVPSYPEMLALYDFRRSPEFQRQINMAKKNILSGSQTLKNKSYRFSYTTHYREIISNNSSASFSTYQLIITVPKFTMCCSAQ